MVVLEVKEYKNGKVRIKLDNGVSFLLYKKEAASFNLKEEEVIDDCIWNQIQEEILVKRARKRVMYLLQKKDYTEKQLRDRLKLDEYPEDIAENAISYVKSYHYVDDGRFASNYVHYHQQNKSVLQMKMELKQKGVSSDQIQQAFDQELEVSQEEVIYNYLRKKNYDPTTADEGEKRRIYQFLMRKGFKSTDILRCMNLTEFA